MAVTGKPTTSVSLTHLPPLLFSPIPRPASVVSVRGRSGTSKFARVNANFVPSKGGAGILERPTFDQSQFDPSTQVLEGGDVGRLKNKKGVGSGDSYRVLLMDDIRHTENLVAKILPQVIPSVTPNDARRLFNESRENGVAVVIVTVKEHAEFYSQMMIRGGLRSTIEPDTNVL
ncbi:ATP-dependent Clp protease adapter protein CLPS1, chloroplastic-like [Carica papaya]|uniref:ATP-dependent Clp protease adapter protein CLPS1, chloroplastic-like n=1 Tax=Carica papaya TaxID=3649 RepID=UPI000B8C72A1|nr:ATP-dependent Clp protease adapter protein CLPS1, chloroplastic-like [Carica papaya]